MSSSLPPDAWRAPSREQLDAIYPEIALLYLDLHRNPELSLHESQFWGNVIRIGNSGAPRLYFTTLRHGMSAEDPYSVRAFKLPEVFWHDLADIVSLMTLGLQAELQFGHQSYDELSSSIDRVNELLEWSRNQPGWTEFHRLRVEFAVGTGLCSRGKNLHQKDDLKKALQIFRSSRLRPKGSSTSEWSAFQETVGQTVFFSARELAEADGCPEVELHDLVMASLREALDGLSAVYAPVQRALCLFQLGTAMQLRDLIAPDYTLTEEALAAFEQCAKLWKPDTDALRWGLAKTKIGEVLTRIGIAQKNEELLYQSVLHCLDARKRLTTIKDDQSFVRGFRTTRGRQSRRCTQSLGRPDVRSICRADR